MHDPRLAVKVNIYAWAAPFDVVWEIFVVWTENAENCYVTLTETQTLHSIMSWIDFKLETNDHDFKFKWLKLGTLHSGHFWMLTFASGPCS